MHSPTLTLKRLTAHGLLLAVALWSLYVWTLATPGLRDRNGNLKGTDFLHLYTLGIVARAHDGGHLYDMRYQMELAARRIPQAAGIGYLPLYPPQVSILFAPFARLSYGRALVLWWTLNALLYGACCYGIWRVCSRLHHYGGVTLLLAISFPGFFNLIAWGQTSAFALACFTGAFFLLRRREQFLAGLVLGFLIYKPQLGLAAAIVFLLVGAWKVTSGALVGSAIELSTGVLYYGLGPVREWVTKILNVRSALPLLEPRPYQTHCLRTFWSMLIPWDGIAIGLYIGSATLVLALAMNIWRKQESAQGLRYSALLLATVLVSPHLTVYDLVILAPAILLLSDWLLGQKPSTRNNVGMLLYLVYALPFLGPLTRWTHLQLSVIAMAVLIYVLWKVPEGNSGVVTAVSREATPPAAKP
jgi:alpha-1,2-mannosyltransferase